MDLSVVFGFFNRFRSVGLGKPDPLMRDLFPFHAGCFLHSHLLDHAKMRTPPQRPCIHSVQGLYSLKITLPGPIISDWSFTGPVKVASFHTQPSKYERHYFEASQSRRDSGRIDLI